MPWGLTRFHHSGQSHFVTFCCYHRRRFGARGYGLWVCAKSARANAPAATWMVVVSTRTLLLYPAELTGDASRRIFELGLERVRRGFRLRVYGYVVLPERVHLLLSEPRFQHSTEQVKGLIGQGKAGSSPGLRPDSE
jgi:REP element-mobilizing transposase RayT